MDFLKEIGLGLMVAGVTLAFIQWFHRNRVEPFDLTTLKDLTPYQVFELLRHEQERVMKQWDDTKVLVAVGIIVLLIGLVVLILEKLHAISP